MTIAKLLEQHRAGLDEARKMLERPRVGSDDLKIGASLKQRREAEIQARIKTLEAERDAVVERIDSAIAVEKEALASLGKQPTDPFGPRGGGSVDPKPKKPANPAKPVKRVKKPKQP